LPPEPVSAVAKSRNHLASGGQPVPIKMGNYSVAAVALIAGILLSGHAMQPSNINRVIAIFLTGFLQSASRGSNFF